MSAYYLAAGLVALAYFCGSVPTGLLAARARGIDIRTRGSGNIGATNVSRNLGRKIGALVLAIDVLKGVVPVVATRALGFAEIVDPLVITACGVAAICGHCFPVWLGFRGGKGVATTLGVMLAADPLLALLSMAVFTVVYLPTRIVSLSSMSAAVSAAVLAWFTGSGDHVVTLAIAAAVIIVGKHHGNIRRLLSGTEPRTK